MTTGEEVLWTIRNGTDWAQARLRATETGQQLRLVVRGEGGSGEQTVWRMTYVGPNERAAAHAAAEAKRLQMLGRGWHVADESAT